MKHPKRRIFTESEPVLGSYVINGSYQVLNGETITSGEVVHKLFSEGVFRYQFLRMKYDPSRRSRICRCSSISEAEWLAGQVNEHDPIVVAMIG